MWGINAAFSDGIELFIVKAINTEFNSIFLCLLMVRKQFDHNTQILLVSPPFLLLMGHCDYLAATPEKWAS